MLSLESSRIGMTSLPLPRPISAHAIRRASGRHASIVPRASPQETEEKSTADAGSNGAGPTIPGKDRFNFTQQTPDYEQLRADGVISDSSDAATKKLAETVTALPAAQQQELANLYLYLVQHPEASLKFAGWSSIQAAFDQYQLALWRPAELLNGRMAMIGFTAAVGCQYLTGASLWVQQSVAPYSYLFAYLLVVAAAALNKQFGGPSKGIGPFTRKAELYNGRAAMMGFALLGFLQYNSDIAKAALYFAQNVQHLQVPNVNA